MKQNLTHRTNVLLSDSDYIYLSNLSKKKNKSLGYLIREALHLAYFSPRKDEKTTHLQKLKKLGSQVNGENISQKEIVEWIQEGRIS